MKIKDSGYLRDDGTPIYNEPAKFKEAECEARGRADRLAGVNPMDCPYVAGLPVYAWERGYFAELVAQI